MAAPMNRSPSTSEESSASTHTGIVLQATSGSAIQSATQSAAQSTPVFQDAFQDFNYEILPEDPLSQYLPRHYLPIDFNQAFSCLHTGIGVELWCVERIWPGICEELWLFDLLYPNILSPTTSAAVIAMLFGPKSNKRKFDCPVFVAEARNGWPRTCNNVKSTNMADLRRHLTDRPGRGYTPQLSFLELCPTCNEDFLDREVFESQHGYRGELCNNRKPGRRGAKAQVQWELLYRQVEAVMWSQHLPTQQNESSSALSGPSAGLPIPSVPGNDVGESPADPKEDEAMPYLTPYQLIVDSDSDKEEPDEEPVHAPSSVSNGPNQPPVPRTWPQSRNWLVDVAGNEPWSAYNRYTEARVRDVVAGHSRPVTSQAPLHDTFSQSSAATSPLISDTTLSRTYDFIQEDGTLNHTKRVGSQQSSNPHFHFSTPDTEGFVAVYHDEEPFENINWTTARSDESHSSHFSYIGSRLSLGQESNKIPNSRDITWPVSDSRVTQPPASCSIFTALSNEDDEVNSRAASVSCLECDKFFYGKYANTNMRRHIRVVHQGTQAKTCMICKKKFRRSDALRKHMRDRHPSHDQIVSNQEVELVDKGGTEINLSVED